MFTGHVVPVKVFFYWPEDVLGDFYWPGAIGLLLASSPDRYGSVTGYFYAISPFVELSLVYRDCYL